MATAPAFLPLAGHPLRWGLLTELARSDRSVRELTAAVGEQQNLVSYHLGKLRTGGLVSVRRSSADRRDAYYTIDLARCGELLTQAGAALHPGLRLVPPAPRRAGGGSVPFLCTPHSAPPQLPEAPLHPATRGAGAAARARTQPQ